MILRRRVVLRVVQAAELGVFPVEGNFSHLGLPQLAYNRLIVLISIMAAPLLPQCVQGAHPQEGWQGDTNVSRLQENLLFDALARAGDGALVANVDGRIVLWNHAAERLLGWSAADVIGRTCCEVLDGRTPDDQGTCDDACPVQKASRSSEAVESFEVRALARSGQPVSLNVSTLSIAADEDRPLTVHLFRAAQGDRSPAHADVLAAAGTLSGEGPAGTLTRREREVLRLLATGANTKVAAERLGVSPATVRNHVQNLLGKLGVHSRLQAVAYATTHRLF